MASIFHYFNFLNCMQVCINNKHTSRSVLDCYSSPGPDCDSAEPASSPRTRPGPGPPSGCCCRTPRGLPAPAQAPPAASWPGSSPPLRNLDTSSGSYAAQMPIIMMTNFSET